MHVCMGMFCVYCYQHEEGQKRVPASERKEIWNELMGEGEGEGEDEESTNIVSHHLSVHMLRHREQDMVTTVVVSNVVDVALAKKCST